MPQQHGRQYIKANYKPQPPSKFRSNLPVYRILILDFAQHHPQKQRSNHTTANSKCVQYHCFFFHSLGFSLLIRFPHAAK
jgi:hypothetical protein